MLLQVRILYHLAQMYKDTKQLTEFECNRRALADLKAEWPNFFVYCIPARVPRVPGDWDKAFNIFGKGEDNA